MKRLKKTLHLSSLSLVSLALSSAALAAAPVMLDQGKEWTESHRQDFYSRDQGSQVMPLPWLKALRQPDGTPFLADSLARYGYLPNPKAPAEGLPVGFTVAGTGARQMVGMTCSACHTRQIEVKGTAYRIDGGPAIVDFQAFLADLDRAVGPLTSDDAAFDAFAKQILGANPPPGARDALLAAVKEWYEPYHTLIERALPKDTWGPARLDAVSMIFNRLTGLDIGTAPPYLIPDNIKAADAPVRYPFLWNAARQNKTQWLGFAANGNDLLGLARNVGEVYGVFATFHPQKSKFHLLGMDYLKVNSANFHGLGKLEELIKKIGPPKWPWAVDKHLARKGALIFARKTDEGGCVECHGIRIKDLVLWDTPLRDVGSDSRQHAILDGQVQTGVMEGARMPFGQPLKATDEAFDVLAVAVAGSILQHFVPILGEKHDAKAAAVKPESVMTDETRQLLTAFQKPVRTQADPYPYESRVLQGIWAAAPYLHNGSVPTLEELLKPAAERVESFPVGSAYDVDKVGLAAQQTQFGSYVLKTTGCEQRASGNSRCGHEYGTSLSAEEKRALLEYLKVL
ncbi:di-heme-cytochrome C peroxidase [Pseudomonas aeruginosa]|nr:di-heme-cytochrome C peroxidase [Pseudomonas aeruginosa]